MHKSREEWEVEISQPQQGGTKGWWPGGAGPAGDLPAGGDPSVAAIVCGIEGMASLGPCWDIACFFFIVRSNAANV